MVVPDGDKLLAEQDQNLQQSELVADLTMDERREHHSNF